MRKRQEHRTPKPGGVSHARSPTARQRLGLRQSCAAFVSPAGSARQFSQLPLEWYALNVAIRKTNAPERNRSANEHDLQHGDSRPHSLGVEPIKAGIVIRNESGRFRTKRARGNQCLDALSEGRIDHMRVSEFL